MSDFKDNIKVIRRENRLTQEQMAQKLGVTEKTIWRWENGLALPSLSDVRKIYIEYGESIEWLLGLRNGR